MEERLNRKGFSSEISHCAQLLNSFIHHGPNGKHFVMVFEILGVNFLEIIKRYDYKGVPIPIVKILAKQCLIGLDYMHRMCRVIHTDFKPENVVIALSDAQVEEISKTGQLSSSKLGKDSVFKRLNMKVAGTLDQIDKDKPAKSDLTKVIEEKKEQRGYDNMTAKQKKNFKKKMQKLKKKVRQGDEQPSQKQESDQESEQPEEKVEEKAEPKATKKKAVQGSLDRNLETGVLEGDEEAEQDDKAAEKKKRRGPYLDDSVRVQICDMGNGCWTYHHFTPEIQTRQYRSPEVIIGADYDTSADVWSFACTIFEMITGDFLFEPRKGQNYDKDDDHLAQMMELLGRMPKNMALSGKNSTQFFDKTGSLKNIRGLNYWPLEKVLMEKYRIKEKNAKELAAFLKPMLSWYTSDRASAQEMLKHPWLNTANDDFDGNYHYTDREYEVLMLKKQMRGSKDNLEDGKQEMSELQISDPEENAADEDSNYSSDESTASFLSQKESKVEFRRAKERQAKINNSFTGPYPLDPIDFPHADKGANTQFTNALKK